MKKSAKLLSLLLSFCMLATLIVPFSASAVTESDTTDTIKVDVTEYGADPTGANDSAPAIQAAIAQVKKLAVNGQHVTLDFPEGRYDIYPDYAPERELYISNTVGDNQTYKNKKIGILLEDVDNVTVEGNNSLFMFHGKMTTFACIDCDNVTFQNYDVDFQVPTVVDVTVEKLEGNNAAVLYIPECYNYEVSGTDLICSSDASPYTGETYWTLTCNSVTYTQRFNIKTGLTYRSNTGNRTAFNNVTAMDDLGNHRVRVTYSSRDAEVQEGLCYQMRPTVRDHSGTFFWKSKDITLQNLDIHFLHGFGMVGQSSENLTLNDVDFETEKGKGTTSAGYADFIQMSGCKGNIEISNCTFSNPHDDPINIHGTFLKVTSIDRENNRIKVHFQHGETAGFPNYFIDDEIEFIRQSTLIPLNDSVRTVTHVDGPNGMGGNDGSGSGNLKDIWLTLDGEIPADVDTSDFVIENITWTPNVNIHNNIFKETPTRGILVTTKGTVEIKDNVFDGMGMASIYISNDANNSGGWYESGRTENVTIENNVFTRGQSAAAIYVQPTSNVGKATPVHGTMNIRNNTFFCTENAYVLDMKSVKNVYFDNNKVYREDPNVTLTATVNNSTSATMAVGSTQKISVTGTGRKLSKKAYTFTNCQHVELSNNLYDGGINANIGANGMQANDFDVSEDAAQVGTGTTTTSGAGVRNYFSSSDPDIVTVSSDGNLTAHKAGTATITVYSVAGERRYDAAPITITVTGNQTASLPTGIHFNAEHHHDVIEVGEDLTNAITVEGSDDADKTVTWHVYDSETLEATDKATIDEHSGTLHALHGGVVTIVASTVNGLEARDFAVIHEADTYTLASNFDIINPHDGAWSITDNNKITIKAFNGGLWEEQTPCDIILGEFPDDTAEDTVEVTVKMHGKTQSGWDEAGLIFYHDGGNYVEIQRKHNGPSNPATINVITETNSSANEDSPKSDIDSEDIYFKLKKENNSVTGYYSDNGTTWTEVRTVTNASLGNDFLIGLSVGTGGSTNETPFEFTELTVNGEKVDMTEIADAGDVDPIPSIEYSEDDNTLYVNADDSLTDPKAKAVVKWSMCDEEDGHYDLIESPSTQTLIATPDMQNKYVKAVIIPTKGGNITGDIYHTDAVLVTGEGVEGAGRYSKAVATLASATFSGLTNNFSTFASGTNFYYTTAETNEKEVTYNFTAGQEDSEINITVNGTPVDGDNGTAKLVNAQNVIEVKVTAAGGVTTSLYRFVISREGDNNSSLSKLAVSGHDITLEKDVYKYAYRIENSEGTETVTFTPASTEATVIISKDGKECKNGEVTVSLGSNLVTVIVTPETHSAPTYYTVNIKIPDPNNSYLESLEFGDGIAVKSLFNKELYTYTASATNTPVSISAVAEEADATVTATLNGTELDVDGNTCADSLNLKSGENTLKITVVSPNGENTKEYTYSITGVDFIYVSDLNWNSNSTIGWGTLHKDAEVEGNPLTLKVDGANKVFEKGIGTHAQSSLFYDVAGKGYIRFESYVGVDAAMGNNGSVTFKVLIDNVEVATTAELTPQSNAVLLTADIPSTAKVIELRSDMGNNNGSDHADWADTKFYTVFSQQQPVAVDKSALIAKSNEAKEIQQDNFSDKTYSALQDAITTADRVIADDNATQDEVDDALETLNTAIADLNYNLGDVNADGKIDSSDATLVLQRYAGIISDSTENYHPSVADIDYDEAVNVTDATLILQKYAGIITKFENE